MNYEEKFYEKFGKKDFTFNEVIRDKYKKRTFLKMTCKKCNHEETKEQFNLFENDKIICCNCQNRKKSEVLNIENEIKKIEINYDLIIKKHEKSKNDIFIYYDCVSCDNESKQSLYEFTKKNITIKFPGYCNKCAQNKRKFGTQHKTEDVKKWFLNKGIEPLFDEYKNSYTFLDLKCACGNNFKMTFKNRFHHNENWIPNCQECKDLDRLKKYNHTYDRYDTRKKDRYWSIQIRKKFNFKCVITGESENISAHHLNGYNCYPEQKYDINNGVVLSEKIHSEFHIKYDKFKGNCTTEQFYEFYELKTGKKFNIKEHESKKN